MGLPGKGGWDVRRCGRGEGTEVAAVGGQAPSLCPTALRWGQLGRGAASACAARSSGGAAGGGGGRPATWPVSLATQGALTPSCRVPQRLCSQGRRPRVPPDGCTSLATGPQAQEREAGTGRGEHGTWHCPPRHRLLDVTRAGAQTADLGAGEVWGGVGRNPEYCRLTPEAPQNGIWEFFFFSSWCLGSTPGHLFESQCPVLCTVADTK